MNIFEGVPPSLESGVDLQDILRRNTMELVRTGVYNAWIDLVDRYFGGKNPEEQAKLSAFAQSELPLAATVDRNNDRRYPGINSYFLVKTHPTTGARIAYGQYGTEPIIVAFADINGTIVKKEGNDAPVTYTEDQVHIVIRQAHELEKLGITMDSMRASGFKKHH